MAKTFVSIIIIAQVISLAVGLVFGFSNRCHYYSLITKYNPGYLVGCELTKPRFELPEEVEYEWFCK